MPPAGRTMAMSLRRRTGSFASGSGNWSRVRKAAGTRGRAGRVVDLHGVWIYAITGHVSAASLDQLRGVGGGPVRAIAAGDLMAVVEDVGLAEFGEQALRRHLEDLDWLAATARAHHRVIDAVAQQGPLVPIRLATVYSNDGGVAAMLAPRDTDFRAAPDRIRGRTGGGGKAQPAGRPQPDDATAGAEAPARP